MTPVQPPWASWAPPLDPPTSGGLPWDRAEQIAAACWADDPHRAAALMWEDYAATLAQTPVVSAVTTGVQSVAYGGAQPGGAFGLAVARANWHWSLAGSAASVPVQLSHPQRPAAGRPPNWWEVGG